MSQSRKMSYGENDGSEPFPISERARVAQEYNTMLDGFVPGDHGQVDLGDGERRGIVRNRLQAAARRRNLTLRFRPGPGPALIFRVEAAPERTPQADRPPQAQQPKPTPHSDPPPQAALPEPPARVAPAARPATPLRDAPPAPGNRRAGAGQGRDTRRPRDERQPAAERYQKMLPRWMREGAQPSQRRSNDRRRRPR